MNYKSVKYHRDLIKIHKRKIDRLKEMIKYHKAEIKKIKSTTYINPS